MQLTWHILGLYFYIKLTKVEIDSGCDMFLKMEVGIHWSCWSTS